MEFLREAASAFVGTGLAILSVGFLARTIVEHWLSKALAKHTAVIETSEHAKRVALERLDRDRAKFVNELMRRVASVNAKFGSPIGMDGFPAEAGPELVCLKRCGDASRDVDALVLEAVTHAHLFEPEFIQVIKAWVAEFRSVLWLVQADMLSALADDKFLATPMPERLYVVRELHRKPADMPVPKFQALLDECRRRVGSS